MVTPQIVFFGLTSEEGRRHNYRHQTPVVRLYPVYSRVARWIDRSCTKKGGFVICHEAFLYMGELIHVPELTAAHTAYAAT